MISMSRRFPAVFRNPPYDLRVAARLDDHLGWATAGSCYAGGRCGMSFVIAVPEFVASAATDLSNIGSGLSAANAAAAAPTTAVVAAAGDEVSAAIAAVFSWHAKEFQALGARAAAFHGEFVRALSGAGGAYSLTEAANASPLGTVEHDVLAVINAPTDLALGRPLIGHGTNGAPGTGQAGGPGGILVGTGGNGG